MPPPPGREGAAESPAPQILPPPRTASSDVLDGRIASGARSGTPLRFWVNAEYLLWWTKAGSTPPLVTTGPATPVVPPPGSLAAPGTVILFGGDERNHTPFSGGRFTLGFWFDACQTCGFEGNFFFLGQRAHDFDANTTGSPVLARPFFDTSTGKLNSELTGFPGLATGSVHVHSTTSLLGGEGNLLHNLCRSCESGCDSCCSPALRYRFDLLAGLRYMELREGLGIAEDTRVAPGAAVFAGSDISAFDQFDTQNRFYGGQLGIKSELRWKRLFVNGNMKVALGDTHQAVEINGATRITTPGGVVTNLPGNLLALPSNIGHYSRDQFSVVPEVGLNVGYQLTRHVSLSAGYTCIYWSNVQPRRCGQPCGELHTRAGEHFSPTGPLDPMFHFHNSGFWAQGLNIGVQLRF